MINNMLYKLFSLRGLSSMPMATFLPFFAYWLIHFQQLSPADTAWVVGAYITTYRAGSIFFSSLVEKYNQNYLLMSALAIMTLVHWLFYLFNVNNIQSLMGWLCSTIMLGCSISITTTIILGWVSQAKSTSTQTHWFAYLNIALNISAGAGPLLGAYALTHYPSLLPIFASIFSVFAFIISCFMPTTSTKNEQHTGGIFTLLKKRDFMQFVIMSSLSLPAYACFYDLYPLFASPVYSIETIGLFFLFCCILIVFLQMPIRHWFEKTVSSNMSLTYANLILAIATLSLFFGNTGYAIIVIIGISLLALAEMIFLPIYQAKTLEKTQEVHSAHAFAILMAMWGFSEALAAAIGTYFIARGYAGAVYFGSALFSVVVAIFFYVEHRRH